MTELVFSVEDIFNDSNQNGCLSQYGSTRYHIPAYQRGYKWSSEPNGAVTILLKDLWSAFEAYQKKERNEYYLQYITIKQTDLKVNGLKESCLEVIDGQQRLTTLSIIQSVLSALLDKNNISTNMLDYAIRDNFFSNHIYQKQDLEALVSKSWEQVAADPNMNKQDIFYLHSAACKAYNFFIEKEGAIEEFAKYMLNYVKLIVNSVEKHVQSETVFKNLNSNKVPLTEADLIKGLIITKVGRGSSKEDSTHFKEILEIRSNLGRHWDEISRWANQTEIRTFYFEKRNDGMHQLLTLVAKCLETDDFKLDSKAPDKDFPLFNFFHKFADYNLIYKKLIDVQASLQDWYKDDEIYNLIGFCRFVKSSKNENLKFLKNCLGTNNKVALKDKLDKEKDKLLPQSELAELKYGADNDLIHAVLLALNVFETGSIVRFNFYEFIEEKWTLEHVFPQSPEGKRNGLTNIEKKAIKEILNEGLNPEIESVLEKDIRTDEEKNLYYNALQESSLLNSIGNMCLLSNPDNISNGCKPFNEKRQNLLKLIQKGSFVPTHTFSVFSKMIKGLESDDLKMWYRADIESHNKYISEIFNIK